MKGDFSRWAFDPVTNFSGVLYQQGRVRTDVDDNAATQIDSHWRETAARDIIGSGVAAVSSDASDGLKVMSASCGRRSDIRASAPRPGVGRWSPPLSCG
jgi:hypothetical protein